MRQRGPVSNEGLLFLSQCLCEGIWGGIASTLKGVSSGFVVDISVLSFFLNVFKCLLVHYYSWLFLFFTVFRLFLRYFSSDIVVLIYLSFLGLY